MEEVDNIILVSLRQLGTEVPADMSRLKGLPLRCFAVCALALTACSQR